MSPSIAKAVRADMAFHNVTTKKTNPYGVRKIPRAAKRYWAALNSKQRGQLHASWKRKRGLVKYDPNNIKISFKGQELEGFYPTDGVEKFEP